MKEYTLIAIAFTVISVLLDRILKTKLTSDRRFWFFWIIMTALSFIVNGYLTWRPIVMYNDDFYLGIRLFTIPVEDFLFGFSLVTLNIVIWEYITNRKNSSQSEQ